MRFFSRFSSAPVSAVTHAETLVVTPALPAAELGSPNLATSSQSSQSHPRSGETPEPSPTTSNASSGTPAAVVATSGDNQTIPQSIISDTSNGQVSAAVQSSKPRFEVADVLSGLQAISKMVLPLSGLPQVAALASQLLTMLEDTKRNDVGFRDLILDISKIIFWLCKPIQKNQHRLITTDHEENVKAVLSYLTTLRELCENYLRRHRVFHFFYSSAWARQINDIRQKVHMQLQLVQVSTLMDHR